MQLNLLRRGAHLAAVAASVAALALPALTAQAAPFDGRRGTFADDGFRTVWTRTDAEGVRANRTWYWGPGAWFDYAEFYRQGVRGLRTVQYFDKARMEINDPNARGIQGGVTNGLLVVELVSGHLKKGNDPADFDSRPAADVPVAGNPRAENPTGPTYASFAGVATVDNNGYRDPSRLGQRVAAALDRSGNIGVRQDLADAHPETELVQYNTVTGHNIPRVFWDFLNLSGPYIEGGAVRSGRIVDWSFAMGLPITDAYWTRARIGAAEKDVLVQLFERRVLTYVPDNPAGYRVEMGNVGQHYFQWRYPHLGQPWAAPDPAPPLLYASAADNAGAWQLYLHASTGRVQLTGSAPYSVGFSYRRSYQPNQTRVLIDSSRGDGQHRQIYELNPEVLYGGPQRNDAPVRRLTYTDGSPIPSGAPYQGYLPNGAANEYNPSISPDGTKIAYVSDRDGAPHLYLMTADGAAPIPLVADGCTNQVPTWSPDGRTLYWERKCGDGRFVVMRGDLSYAEDSTYGVQATLANVRALTEAGSDSRYPRVAPNGRTLVFTSYRDGNAEVYSIDASGENLRRLTSSAGDDEAATWSADGSRLAFASNRTGSYQIFQMNADGSGVTQLTNDDRQNRWPMWAQ